MGEFIRTDTAEANSDPAIARDPGAFRLRSSLLPRMDSQSLPKEATQSSK